MKKKWKLKKSQVRKCKIKQNVKIIIKKLKRKEKIKLNKCHNSPEERFESAFRRVESEVKATPRAYLLH